MSAEPGESPARSPRAARSPDVVRGISPSSSDPFASFPLSTLQAAAHDAPAHSHSGRRASSISFPTTGNAHRNGSESPGKEHLGTDGCHSVGAAAAPHSILNRYRSAREAYYHHFEVDTKAANPADLGSPRRDGLGNSSDQVRCVQLASVALGLSYLLADLPHTKGKFPNLRVTHEDIIEALQLPISQLNNSFLTFHEVCSIVTRFVNSDPRFNEFEVVAMTFDTKRAEQATTLATIMEEETSRRTSVLSATELRSAISDDGVSFDRVKIACFDAEIVSAENVIEVDEQELENDELLSNVIGGGVRAVGDAKDELRRRPGTHNGCAVIADIHRTLNSVQLMPVVSVEPLKVRRVDVPLKTLLDALSVRNPDSSRAQGIVEMRKRGSTADMTEEGMMGISLETGQHNKLLALEGGGGGGPSNFKAPVKVPNVFGDDWNTRVAWSRPTEAKLEHYDFTIANHLLATATALHLVNSTRFPSLDVNQIVAQLCLPASHVMLGATVHCLQWYSMVQTLAALNHLGTDYVPMSRQVKKPGATPFVSVSALQELISKICAPPPVATEAQAEAAAEEEAKQQSARRVVMLVCFDGNRGRESLNYVTPGENPISYAIVAGYHEASETVLLIDCDIKRNDLHWTLSMDTLHNAMIDYGAILLTDNTDGHARDRLYSVATELDAYCRQVKSIPAYVPVTGLSLGAAESFWSPTPVALCAVAASRLGFPVSLDDFLLAPPCNVSHMLSPHISLFDVARLFNSHCRRHALPLRARPLSLSTDRAMHRKISLPSFVALVKKLLDDGAQVLVNISRHALVYAPNVELLRCPSWALVLAVPNNDTVVLAGASPSPQHRKFQVSFTDLFKACEDICATSRRAKGLLSLHALREEELAAAEAMDAGTSACRDLHFRTLNTHAFRPLGIPQLQALAMAFTALGHTVGATEVFFTVAKNADEAIVEKLRPISALHRKLTLQDIIRMANVYLRASGKEGSLSVTALPGSSRNGQVTRDDVMQALQQCKSGSGAAGTVSGPKEVLLCVYDAKNAHDCPHELFSAGLAGGIIDNDRLFLCEAEPSSWGEWWETTPAAAAECMVKDPDDADRERVGVVRVALI